MLGSGGQGTGVFPIILSCVFMNSQGEKIRLFPRFPDGPRCSVISSTPREGNASWYAISALVHVPEDRAYLSCQAKIVVERDALGPSIVILLLRWS